VAELRSPRRECVWRGCALGLSCLMRSGSQSCWGGPGVILLGPAAAPIGRLRLHRAAAPDGPVAGGNWFAVGLAVGALGLVGLERHWGRGRALPRVEVFAMNKFTNWLETTSHRQECGRSLRREYGSRAYAGRPSGRIPTGWRPHPGRTIGALVQYPRIFFSAQPGRRLDPTPGVVLGVGAGRGGRPWAILTIGGAYFWRG